MREGGDGGGTPRSRHQTLAGGQGRPARWSATEAAAATGPGEESVQGRWDQGASPPRPTGSRPLTLDPEPDESAGARGQGASAAALTWMPWKSCCSSSQSRRQSPSGPGGGGCMAAAAPALGPERGRRTPLARPARGASAANWNRPGAGRALAPPPGAANGSPGRGGPPASPRGPCSPRPGPPRPHLLGASGSPAVVRLAASGLRAHLLRPS